MALKLTNGVYALSQSGLPREATRQEELLQNVLMRLTVPQGAFPYGRELGSGLSRLDLSAEHAAEQAVSLAGEALLDLPEVTVKRAVILSGGTRIRFYLDTPEGEKAVTFTPAG